MRSLSLTAQITIRTADVNRLILPIAQRHVRSRFDFSSSGFECHLLVLNRTKSKVAGSAVMGRSATFKTPTQAAGEKVRIMKAPLR
jgi:hypothetical protein